MSRHIGRLAPDAVYADRRIAQAAARRGPPRAVVARTLAAVEAASRRAEVYARASAWLRGETWAGPPAYAAQWIDPLGQLRVAVEHPPAYRPHPAVTAGGPNPTGTVLTLTWDVLAVEQGWYRLGWMGADWLRLTDEGRADLGRALSEGAGAAEQ